MRLQTAIQTKNEGPQEFADLCRALAQKVMCKDSDPVAQRIHHENAEWMLLASFVAGLSGVAGRQVRYQNPQTLQHALSIALSVREAENQERFSESFYAKFDESVSVKPRSTSRSDRERHSARRTADDRPSNYMSGQQYRTSHSTNMSLTSASTRDVQTRAELRWYECEGRRHVARECPTRLKGARTQNSPGKGNPSGRLMRPRSSGDENPSPRNGEANRKPVTRETIKR